MRWAAFPVLRHFNVKNPINTRSIQSCEFAGCGRVLQFSCGQSRPDWRVTNFPSPSFPRNGNGCAVRGWYGSSPQMRFTCVLLTEKWVRQRFTVPPGPFTDFSKIREERRRRGVRLNSLLNLHRKPFSQEAQGHQSARVSSIVSPYLQGTPQVG